MSIIITERYNKLIHEHGLKYQFLEDFQKRLTHAKATFRTLDAFFNEELIEVKAIEDKILERELVTKMKGLDRQRKEHGITHTDKLIHEYKQQIKTYPQMEINRGADEEVERLYGAISEFDKYYWKHIEAYLRKAFPQAGQIDRMSLEQRFWRLVSSRKGQVPEVLKPYQRILAFSTSSVETLKEAREALKTASFFFHDLIAICEMAQENVALDSETREAINYIKKVLTDFRLQSLNKR